MCSEATQLLCNEKLEEPKIPEAADGKGGERDWERVALASVPHAKPCKAVYPILSKSHLLCFQSETPSIFFLSWGEGAQGERDEHTFQKRLCQSPLLCYLKESFAIISPCQGNW